MTNRIIFKVADVELTFYQLAPSPPWCNFEIVYNGTMTKFMLKPDEAKQFIKYFALLEHAIEEEKDS